MFALAAVFLLALSGAASAVTVTTIPVTGSPLEITISGHLIAYTDEVSFDNNTMHVVDLGNGLDTAITPANAATRISPTIDGTRVVWYEGSGNALFLYDTSAPVFGGTLIPGTGTPPTAYTFTPALSGNILAWQIFDFSGAMKSDVWYQTPLGAAAVQVTNLAGSQFVGNLAVSGKWIVWFDSHTGTNNIYYYDTSAVPVPGGTPIAPGASNQLSPRIFGNDVVFSDNAGGDSEIYLYTLPGGPLQQITDNTGIEDYAPDISGNYVVFLRNGQVCLYDRTTLQTTQLTNGPETFMAPRIDGNHVVWLNVPPETDPATPSTAYLATIQAEVAPQLPYTGK